MYRYDFIKKKKVTHKISSRQAFDLLLFLILHNGFFKIFIFCLWFIFPFFLPIYGKERTSFSMFHQKSRGVSLILFSDWVPKKESVEKPNYAGYGHGASILDYTMTCIHLKGTFLMGVIKRAHSSTIDVRGVGAGGLKHFWFMSFQGTRDMLYYTLFLEINAPGN